jgi:hypothetical protein
MQSPSLRIQQRCSALSAFNPGAPAFMTTPSSTQPEGAYGASCTSYYTSTEKKESYESLNDVLNAKCNDPKVRQVLTDMLDVCADITEALRTALVTVEGSTNDFGDTQLSVDVSRSNRLTRDRLTHFVHQHSSRALLPSI